MAKISVVAQDTQTLVQVEGIIDESFDLTHVPTALNKALKFYCRKVTRVNSTGIKKWILFFQSLEKRGVKFSFFELSPPMVEQFNAVLNFGVSGHVESICLPYTCEKCDHSFVTLRTTEQLKSMGQSVPNETCPQCKAPNAEFDDVEDEYLEFLHR